MDSSESYSADNSGKVGFSFLNLPNELRKLVYGSLLPPTDIDDGIPVEAVVPFCTDISSMTYEWLEVSIAGGRPRLAYFLISKRFHTEYLACLFTHCRFTIGLYDHILLARSESNELPTLSRAELVDRPKYTSLLLRQIRKVHIHFDITPYQDSSNHHVSIEILLQFPQAHMAMRQLTQTLDQSNLLCVRLYLYVDCPDLDYIISYRPNGSDVTTLFRMFHSLFKDCPSDARHYGTTANTSGSFSRRNAKQTFCGDEGYSKGESGLSRWYTSQLHALFFSSHEVPAANPPMRLCNNKPGFAKKKS